MIDKILRKNGRVPKSQNRKIAACFYKQLKDFSSCVKTAPAAPQGLEFKPKRNDNSGDMARVFMKSIIDVAGELKDKKRDNDWYGD